MSLIDHAIWWHVYPLGACGAPIRERGDDAEHRLRRLDAWLDYAIELGCSGLLLAPLFESASHGYDTLDFFRLDARLGDDADFDHLVAECHRRGLAVMLDGVFNHVSVRHPLVAASLAGESNAVRVQEVEGRRVPLAWEGAGDLALLNHDDPAVVDLVVEVMLHWLRRGVAGWRLDVAYAVPPLFWAEVTDRVRAEFPDALFLGEVIHGDYPAIAEAGHLDTITQYELWKAIWSTIQTTNCWELAHALERHAGFSRHRVLNTFVGNHDVARIASLVGDAGASCAAVLLATLPGMPSIYYGDEQGFRGVKLDGWSADDELRPALPASPAELAPFGWPLHDLYRDALALRRRCPWLTRGALRVVAKENPWIEYEVSGEGHVLRARLDLQPSPRVRVEVDGVEQLTWGMLAQGG